MDIEVLSESMSKLTLKYTDRLGITIEDNEVQINDNTNINVVQFEELLDIIRQSKLTHVSIMSDDGSKLLQILKIIDPQYLTKLKIIGIENLYQINIEILSRFNLKVLILDTLDFDVAQLMKYCNTYKLSLINCNLDNIGCTSSNIKYLRIIDTNITGRCDLSGFKSLQRLLIHNSITGIYPNISNCNNLVQLSYQDNQFNSSPNLLLNSLRAVRIVNCGLTVIPRVTTNITYLNLSNNNMIGNISSLSNCTNLTRLELQYNNLVGSISEELLTLERLDTLVLDHNDFSNIEDVDIPKLEICIDNTVKKNGRIWRKYPTTSYNTRHIEYPLTDNAIVVRSYTPKS